MNASASTVAARPPARNATPAALKEREQGFLTLLVDGQLCGVPVLSVRDVIAETVVTRIPLAPPEIAGNINLRGKIVTAIDLRRRLSLRPAPAGRHPVAVVAEFGAGSYALLVDQALEVLTLDPADIEPPPPTLGAVWIEFSAGIFRLPDRLMVVLDIGRLLFADQEAKA
ncbi:chemotaxis protein CheW [Lichenicoccus roseus]|uniref:Chemotaxis protein CheW n=1 Tax=Lichenicoccus roseus TaxID=2683649 RepID=A0A5R9JHY9_9PROT|nr:chemotaxis protein CheW [Lichenicoccus roseus]TLU73938.1 chemotaxis protein CheW [Lichenicoccus roseus]